MREGASASIYIDPPYNMGNEGWDYNDNVNGPKICKWLGEVVGREGENLSRHDKWLCMLYPQSGPLCSAWCVAKLQQTKVQFNNGHNLRWERFASILQGERLGQREYT